MKVRKAIARMIVLILPLLVLCASVYAQAGFGVIAGRVTDPSGAIIVGANVAATNVDTNVRTATASNSNGDFQLLQLIPGRYRIEAEAPGFKTLKREGITVQVADRLTIDLALTLGQNVEVVSITAEAPLLRTLDAQTGEVVNSKFIQNLPQLNRDPLQLLVISSNVQGSGERAEGGHPGSGSDTRINGGRTSGIEYLVDGLTAGTGVAHGVTSVTPSMEAVAEFKVVTNGISAEYGRLSGGAVELVTRSGGNQLHGQLFEYMQNEKLNANSWRQNSLGGEKTPFKNNDFGVAAGGPILLPKLYNGRNRTFFFANFEGIRFRQSGELKVTSVPTALERTGDFTQTFYDGVRPRLFDPDAPDSTLINHADGAVERTVLLADGQHVPAGRIDPLATALLKFVPLPTPGFGRANSSSAANYKAPQDTSSGTNMWAVRIDHAVNDRHRIFGRFTHQGYDQSQTRWRGPLSTAPESHIPGAFGATLNYDWTVSPTLIFSARLGGTFSPFTGGELLPPDFSNADLPFDPETKRILGANNIPIIANYGGGGEPKLQVSDSKSRSVHNSTTYNAVVSLTKVLTRHTLKFGYEHRRYYDNFINDGKSWSAGGYWLINGNPVAQFVADGPYDAQHFANAFAPFLMGIMGVAWVDGPTNRAVNLNYHAGYIQDDIKVTPKLTINAGLRWDMETPMTERYDRLYFWDPDAPPQFHINAGYDWNAALQRAGVNPSRVPAPSWVANGFPKGAIRIPNTPEFSSRTGFKYHPYQFAPRLGLAYQLNSKTVLRASFAQMYMSTTGNPESNSASQDIALGDSANSGWHAGGFAHYTSTFRNPYGGNMTRYVRDTAVANYQVSGDSFVVSGFSRDTHMPHEYTWSLGVQRQLPKGLLVAAEYSANHGSGLLAPDFLSRFPRAQLKPENASLYGTKVDSPTAGQRRNPDTDPQQKLSKLMFPYPYYGPIKLLGANIGRSNYNSLNLRAERRLTQGMGFLLNYTFGKLLDNVGGPEANNDNSVIGGRGAKVIQSVDTVHEGYGYSPYDETHRLAFTYNLELPFGRGKRFLGSPNTFGRTMLDYAVGGWELSGTTLYRSGRPVIFGYGNTNINNDYGIEATFGSYATSDTNLANSAFAGPGSVFFSVQDNRPSSLARRFDPAKFLQPETFTYGTLPPVYANIRHPGNTNYNISLMKRFPLAKDVARYFQFRLEAMNAFNIRGFGTYNTTVGNPDFGLITAAGNTERRMQMSARILF